MSRNNDSNIQARQCNTVNIIWISLALLFLPGAASANLVFPSVVQWLSSAGPCSILLLPMIFTVPLLLTISTIEAFIVRTVCKPCIGRFRLILILFFINMLTSTVGIFTMPNGTELIPGIPYAFLATTVLEAFGLVLIFPKGKRRLSLGTFKASALMNGASYLFLGFLLAALIYLPAMRMRNDLDKKELTGKIVVLDRDSKPVASIELPSGKYSSKLPAVLDKPVVKYKVVNVAKERWIVEISTGKRIGMIPPRSYHNEWQISADGRYYANFLANSTTVIIGDAQKGTQKSFEGIDEAIMHTGTGRVALRTDSEIIVYEPANDKIRTLKPDGMDYFTEHTWSPDGRYVAYFSEFSPFTQAVGEKYPNAIRVVSITGKSATVAKNPTIPYFWSDLIWLR